MTSDQPPSDAVLDPGSRIERPLYLTLSARPPRLGVVLPLAKDVPWQRTYEMALAAQSPLWGGDANLVLPATNDIHDNELFWTLAERLDADYFVSAAFTHRDVGEADPQWLAEWKAGLEAAVDRDIPDASHEARAGLIERELDEVALEARPDDAFADLLERRLAPFHRRRVARFPRLLAVNERRPRAVISHEFANVLQIRRSITQVNNPHTSLGSLEQLLLTAQLGRLASGFEAALTQSTNIIVTPSEVNDRHEWASLIFDPRLAGATAVPRTLNHLGLGWYRHGPGERERVILVTGETPWDFTLYYALLRWRGSAVYWLPQGLTDDGAYTSALGMALRDAGRRAGDDTVTVVTSSDEDFRDQAVAALAEGTLSMFGVPASAADWRAVVPEEPVRLLDGERPGRAEPVAVHDGATVELPTPIPAAAEEGPNRLRWVTDVRAHGWAPVRHGSLAAAVLQQPMFDSDYARAGRSGVAYTSTGAITLGAESLAMSTVRPILHPIALLAQLNAVLGADGWSCQGSDKGAYAAQSARLFGGFRSMASALLDAPVRSVIEAFRDAKAPGKSTADRRYLTLADMVCVLGGDGDSAASVLDQLTGAGVLTRGLFLKCATCRRGGWYDLSEVTGVFRCRAAASSRASPGSVGWARSNLRGITSWRRSSTRCSLTTASCPSSPYTRRSHRRPDPRTTSRSRSRSRCSPRMAPSPRRISRCAPGRSYGWARPPSKPSSRRPGPMRRPA